MAGPITRNNFLKIVEIRTLRCAGAIPGSGSAEPTRRLPQGICHS
jgi:hypothetical protein